MSEQTDYAGCCPIMHTYVFTSFCMSPYNFDIGSLLATLIPVQIV